MSVGEKARAIVAPLEKGVGRATRDRGRHWLLEEVGVATGAAAVTLLIAAVVMEAWNWSLHSPSGYGGDAIFNTMVVKDVLHHGWYFTNPNLGAPFHQELYDFPLGGDNLHFLLIKGFGLFSSNAFVVINLFFAATFVLVTLSAYLVLRCLRVSRIVSAGLSILYALLPYHFVRGEGQLFLSGYYAVPLAVLLIVWALGESPLAWRTESMHSRGIRLQFDRRRSLAALACCVVLGSTDSYYAIFAVVTLLGCGAVVAIGRRGWQNLATCAVMAAIILLVLGVNLAPSLIYQHLHGVDPIASLRFPQDSELLGLKIARLFLPVTGHRFGPFASFTASYNNFPLPSEGTEALGAIFSVGLILLLARGLAGRLQVTSDGTGVRRTLNTLAIAALVAILVGAMTGLSGIIALAITPQIRSWNRISVLIAFCAAAGLGLLLDQLLARLRAPTWRIGLPSLLMAGLVVVGTLDQTTTSNVPDYRLVSDRLAVDQGFVSAVQRHVPRGAMIFQLPYLQFPENGGPLYGMQDYEEAAGYLFSDDLRWSYGVMKGRPQDWARPLTRYPLPLVARGAAVAGFAGVYVNRTGYSDGGVGVDGTLRQITGPPVVTSSDGTLELYDLQPLAAQLRARFTPAQLASLAYAVLHQTTVEYGSGFYQEENDPTTVWRWASGRAQLELANPDPQPTTLRLQGTLVTPGATPSKVTITGDGVNEVLTTTNGGTPFATEARIPPGKSVITISTDAPRLPQPGDGRYLHLKFVDPQFFDPALAPLQQ